MKIGNRIDNCPLIPFVIPNPRKVDYHEISKVLQFGDKKPHLIYLANSTFEDPPYTESVNIHVLHFRTFKLPKTSYYDFLNLVCEIISNYPNQEIPYIGVASRSTPDFCEYFIVRWLFLECGYSMNDSLELVQKSLPPGIRKEKFLHKLSNLNNRIQLELELSSQPKSNRTPSEAYNQNELEQPQKYENSIPPEATIEENQIQIINENQESNESITINQDQQIPQNIAEEQLQQSNEISTDPYQQQLQIQRQQRQQQQLLLKQLQAKAQEYYQYQNEINQRLQDFKSQPYDYQQQNISYQIQLQNHLQEAANFLKPIELQIQQIQASQIQLPPKQPKQASSGIPPATSSVTTMPPNMIDPLAVESENPLQNQQKPEEAAITEYNSNANMQNLIQNQQQPIEQPVPPQHVTMYFNEIKKMMNVPNKKRLFTKYAPMTLSQLEMIKNQLLNDPRKNQSDSLTYCLMPEPEGIRAILYLRRKIPILIFQEYSPIQLKLDINTSDDDLYIFEVILVRLRVSNIVLCDVMFAKDEDVSSRPFNYRIGIVKDCYEKIFKPLNSAQIKFTIRPFYKLNNFRLLTDLFTNKPHKHFTQYPLTGITLTLINSGNCHMFPCMYLWTKNIIKNPRVQIKIDFGSRCVFGYARCGTTSAYIAYLGKLTPEMFDINGKVVEIEVLEQDPAMPGVLNARIIRTSDDYAWTTSKFLKYYPGREPHMDIQGLDAMLEKLSLVS